MSSTVVSTKRTSWFGTTFWVVVGGLLLLNVSVFIEYFDPLTIQQCLFRLDFRHWLPGLACPLWLLAGFLVFDAATLRQPCINAGKWRLHFLTLVFSAKVCLAIIVIYQFVSLFATFHSSWLWWYPANLLLLAVFLKKWAWIYSTRNQVGFSPEELNVRKKFLTMSITIAGELGICNVLPYYGFFRELRYSLWRWFGFGAYSHWAAVTFVLLCVITGLTIFVLKEWLAAIRQVRKVNKTLITPQQSEVSHDTRNSKHQR